jgi:acyl carrier protein
MTVTDPRALLARLLHRIAPDADLAAVADDASWLEELDLDSVDFLHLVSALRDEAGVEVPERDYPQLITVPGFVAYVARAPTAPPRQG